MSDNLKKYIHLDKVHNLNAPQIIVPYIMELLNPTSVIDVGCGTGTFLKCFTDAGVQSILGIDGHWVEKNKLHIPAQNFIEADLEKPVPIKGTYDIVLCLEVAEHLSAEASDTIVETLISFGKVIIFSAAIQNQGGQNHLNEQPFSFWQQKFQKHQYYYCDVFRPQFWNIQELNWWYKQNMFLVAHQSADLSTKILLKKITTPVLTSVHPDLFNAHIADKNKVQVKLEQTQKKLDAIRAGENSLKFYIKLILIKIRSFLIPYKQNKK